MRGVPRGRGPSGESTDVGYRVVCEVRDGGDGTVRSRLELVVKFLFLHARSSR